MLARLRVFAVAAALSLAAGFLSARQAAPAAGQAAQAETSGDAAAGEALFFGKADCASCHLVNGRGGVTGPDLSDAGRLSAAVLRQRIVDPNAAPAAVGRGGGRGAPAGPTTVVARTKDGREIRGIRRNEDTFSLQLVDAKGQLHLLDKLALAGVTVETTSLKPADYGTRLTAAELDHLVAYLRALAARDPVKTASAPPAPGGVTAARLLNARNEPHNWLMYWGDYQGTHYSSLKGIDTTNVKSLRPAWSMPIPGDGVAESTPIVVDGVMYTSAGANQRSVTAIDARSGRQIWRWTRQQKTKNPGETDVVTRGVTVYGQRVFVGTGDAFLYCLDARTGAEIWDVQIGDTMEGFNVTSPPLIVKDKILIGHAGGEYAIRGFLDAYDLSGKRLWRHYTIPAEGEPGSETWKGDSWRTGGGATWLTGTYDPELNTVYWPVGNPAAMTDRSVRGDADNLYTDSVIAIDPDTGRRKWHYQFTPNDGHDWDSAQDMMLVDRMWQGQNRKLLLHADRNAHFYVIDRTTGKFLAAWPFVYQNWNAGFDANGRPMPVPGSNSSPEGSFFVYPTGGGATNWQSPSYSPLTGYFYLEYSENGAQYVSAPQVIEKGREWLGRGRASTPAVRKPNEPPASAGVKALDVETGKTVWDYKLFQGSLSNGVLATAGGILFASARDGNLMALDAKTGQHLWHYQTGGGHAAAPMSYAVDGRQYIALSAGNVVYAFALPQ